MFTRRSLGVGRFTRRSLGVGRRSACIWKWPTFLWMPHIFEMPKVKPVPEVLSDTEV
jgi:hypothetical protein